MSTLNNILDKMKLKEVYYEWKKGMEDNNPDEINKILRHIFKKYSNHERFNKNIIKQIMKLDKNNKNDKQILKKLNDFFVTAQTGDLINLNIGSTCRYGDQCYQTNDEHSSKYHERHWTIPIIKVLNELSGGKKTRKRKSEKRKTRKRKT